MAVTERRRRLAVEPGSPATLVMLPPLAGSGYTERRVMDVAAYGGQAVRVPTHRRHDCGGKKRR